MNYYTCNCHVDDNVNGTISIAGSASITEHNVLHEEHSIVEV